MIRLMTLEEFLQNVVGEKDCFAANQLKRTPADLDAVSTWLKESGFTRFEHYPPLHVQHQKQLEIVKKDKRLRRLIGGFPKPFPDTGIIPLSRVPER